MKAILLIVLCIIVCKPASGQDNERRIFLDNKFGERHYLIADSLNLDFANYNRYRQNLRQIRSADIKIGIGSGLLGTGMLITYLFSLEHRSEGGTVLDSPDADLFLMGAGTGIAGLILIFNGRARFDKLLSVHRKDGSVVRCDFNYNHTSKRVKTALSFLF